MSRTTKLASLLSILAVSFGLVVAGCGGDDEESTSTTETTEATTPEPTGDRLGNDEYGSQLTSILQPLGTGLQTAGSDIQSGGDREAIITGLTDSDELLTTAIDDIGALNPPEDAQEGHDKLLSALQGYRDEVNSLKAIAEDGSDEELATAGADFATASTDFAAEIGEAQQLLSEAGVQLGAAPTGG